MSKPIQDHHRIKIRYSVYADGRLIESSGDKPFEYRHGAGEILCELEAVLEGRCAGEQVELILPKQQLFISPDPKAVVKVPLDKLAEDVRCEIGGLLEGQDAQGNPFQVTVKAVEADGVVVDLNHPCAGKDMRIQVDIVDVQGNEI